MATFSKDVFFTGLHMYCDRFLRNPLFFTQFFFFKTHCALLTLQSTLLLLFRCTGSCCEICGLRDLALFFRLGLYLTLFDWKASHGEVLSRKTTKLDGAKLWDSQVLHCARLTTCIAALVLHPAVLMAKKATYRKKACAILHRIIIACTHIYRCVCVTSILLA